MGDTHWVMSAVTAKTRAVFLFHGSAEVRRVDKVPQRGARVRSRQGRDWVVCDVLRSGVDTYTVTCVGPDELHGIRARGLAYLRRDREFVLLALLWSALFFVCLSQIMRVWAAVVLVAIVAGLAWFAWVTK